MSDRINCLDYLRGVFACLIMTYHFFEWNAIKFFGVDFLKVWSSIGVPGFYILSGITLYLMYKDRMSFEYPSILNFYISRVFRIFPVLWIAIFLTILSTRELPSTEVLFLNFTGLFSVFAWDKYIATGSWSIGNELFFYLCFPMILFLFKKSLTLFYTFFVLTIFIFFFFIFKYIDVDFGVLSQWEKYVNPLNHVFYFYLGVILGTTYSSMKNKIFFKIYLIILLFIISISIFGFTNIGDPIVLFVGGNRLILTALVTSLVFSSLISNMKLKAYVHRPLKYLGDLSYSIYLLHPFLFYFTQKLCDRLIRHDVYIPYQIRFSIFIVLTFVSSYFIWKYVETYFIKLGKGLLIKDVK